MYMGNHTPGVGINRLVARLRPWRMPDSIGCQEVGRYTNNLHRALGYKVFFKDGTSRYTRSNAILLRRGLRVIDFHFLPAAEGTGTRVTPPRSILVLKYKKRGKKIAHINTHMHVVPEDQLAHTPENEYGKAARQYRDHAILLNETILSLKKDGYVVVVTGDMNTRHIDGQGEWKYSVYNHIKTAGMKTVVHGVDLVAYPVQATLIDSRVVPKAVTGSDDHDAIAIRIKTS